MCERYAEEEYGESGGFTGGFTIGGGLGAGSFYRCGVWLGWAYSRGGKGD